MGCSNEPLIITAFAGEMGRRAHAYEIDRRTEYSMFMLSPMKMKDRGNAANTQKSKQMASARAFCLNARGSRWPFTARNLLDRTARTFL